MPIQLHEQEARRDVLSGSTGGGAISVALDYTNAADVTTVHHVTTGYADSIWLQAHNKHTADVTLSLVLNPSDDTSTSAIDAVTVDVVIPANDSLWVLQGDAFRLRGSNTKTVAAYTATADVDRIMLTGYVVRVAGSLLY
jgi:heptaprenylglyceryl phosphate synthase